MHLARAGTEQHAADAFTRATAGNARRAVALLWLEVARRLFPEEAVPDRIGVSGQRTQIEVC